MLINPYNTIYYNQNKEWHFKSDKKVFRFLDQPTFAQHNPCRYKQIKE